MIKRWVIVLTAYLGVCAAGGAYVVDQTLHRPRQQLTGADRAQAEALARTHGAKLETVSIEAGDRVTLRGWLFSASQPTVPSILLAHGIASNRASMLAVARLFVERGYRALVVDLRGAGESGGEYGTYGALETDDLHRWIAWMRRADRPGVCVYELGISLGAALVLGAASAPGLCGVVAQSPFASLREIGFDRIGQQAHVGPWAGRSVLRPGIELAFLYARFRYGVDLNDASALASVARPGAPVLVIQGMDDDNVPRRHALMLQAANPERVSLWLVPGATHDSIRSSAGAEYPLRVMDFVAAHRSVQP